jgi:TolB-like protein/Flp pilus assembly protein TadD
MFIEPCDARAPFMALFKELNRRNVTRVAVAYLVSAWLIIEATETILPLYGFGDTPARVVVAILAVGFPLFLVFSWIFEITPEGLKLEKDIERETAAAPRGTRKNLDRAIIVLLGLALVYFIVDKFALEAMRTARIAAEAARQARTEALVQSYGERSIAVLPFVNMSDDPGNEYFSDGISEELLSMLARVPELRVTSRSSAFAFKDRDVDIPTIARQLNVRHILEGSVRKAGDQVRVTVQLIDGPADSHVWSATYDRTLDDIFTIQDEIAAAVVAALKLELLGGPPRSDQIDPGAFALYLQAMYLGNQGKAEAYEQAIALLQRVIEIAPGYARAWRGLAANYINQVGSGLRTVEEGYAMASEATRNALALDPGDALAHASLGWIAMTYDGDLASAARHFEHALSLEPANYVIVMDSAELMHRLGRLEEAIELLEYVSIRDPVNPTSHGNLSTAYLWAGRFDAAIAAMRTALTLSPGRFRAHYRIGEALLLLGDPEAALEEMQDESMEGFRLIGEALAYHSLGQGALADAALTSLIEKYERHAAYNIAYVYAYRGDADLAFDWLEKAVTLRDPGLPNIVSNIMFRALHDDPRWLPFLEAIGKSPEQLQAIDFSISLSVNSNG